MQMIKSNQDRRWTSNE